MKYSFYLQQKTTSYGNDYSAGTRGGDSNDRSGGAACGDAGDLGKLGSRFSRLKVPLDFAMSDNYWSVLILIV